jgi:hypothetical protein
VYSGYMYKTPIHESTDNLKYINNSSDILQNENNILHDNLTELDINNVIFEGIQCENSHDNISIKIENTSTNEKIDKLALDIKNSKITDINNLRKILLLNFEDDTTKPVIEIEDIYINIIKKWYEDCNLIVDVEKTDVMIPINITLDELSGVLFKEINYQHKDEYLCNFIPLVVNEIISKKTIKKLEDKFFVKKEPLITKTNMDYKNVVNKLSLQINNKLKELKIEMPKNIEPDKLTDENKNILKHTNHSLRFGRGNNSELIAKHISDKPYIEFKELDADNCELYDNYIYIDSMISDAKDKNIPKCYNFEYDCLYTPFGDNCEEFETKIKYKNRRKNECIYVLINDKFLQTLTVKNPDDNIEHIIENHPEYGFFKLFKCSTENNNIVSFIEREFDKVGFNDGDEINKKLLATSQYIEFANKQNGMCNEEKQVKHFLNTKYIINDDINKKMKASTLYDIVFNSNAIKIEKDKEAGFRTRLSKYLKDLGLQKKRYNDGFYYYGIVDKLNELSRQLNGQKNVTILYDELIKKREEELKIFMK